VTCLTAAWPARMQSLLALEGTSSTFVVTIFFLLFGSFGTVLGFVDGLAMLRSLVNCNRS